MSHLDITNPVQIKTVPLPVNANKINNYGISDSAAILFQDSGNIFVYDRQNGLSEPLTQLLAGGRVANSQGIGWAANQEKLAIRTESTNYYREVRILYFDGKDLRLAFPGTDPKLNWWNYALAKNEAAIAGEGLSLNPTTGTTKSVFSLNIETGLEHEIPVSANQTLEQIIVSPTHVAYVLADNYNSISTLSTLNVADIASPATPTPIVVDQSITPIKLYEFTDTGNAFFGSAHSGPRELIKYEYDNRTGSWIPKTIANE